MFTKIWGVHYTIKCFNTAKANNSIMLKNNNAVVRINFLEECRVCRDNYSCDFFAILDSGSNDLDITIKEAMHIKSRKPWLNKQLSTQGSSFVLNIFG